MITLKKYFDFAVKNKASDLHLVGGEPAILRKDGQLITIEKKDLNPKELETALLGLLTKEQKEYFLENLELDFAYEHNGFRFRMNYHRQSSKIALSARLVPSKIPSPTDLRFEDSMRDFTQLLDGLVLVVGPTGQGKSTTIASMIEEINQTRRAHIITIEDPVEFLFESKESLIEQREIGIDTRSFGDALKYVLRQDPNVIFVGEMRDPETIATVLTAAETGHLVFSTLHTATAAETIKRIIDVFSGSKQKQILSQLSSVLRGVVSQQLIVAKDGSRVAAREILVNTPAVSNLIRENDTSQIKSMIQTGASAGMRTMETSLLALEKDGLIEGAVAKKRFGRMKKV